MPLSVGSLICLSGIYRQQSTAMSMHAKKNRSYRTTSEVISLVSDECLLLGLTEASPTLHMEIICNRLKAQVYCQHPGCAVPFISEVKRIAHTVNPESHNCGHRDIRQCTPTDRYHRENTLRSVFPTMEFQHVHKSDKRRGPADPATGRGRYGIFRYEFYLLDEVYEFEFLEVETDENDRIRGIHGGPAVVLHLYAGYYVTGIEKKDGRAPRPAGNKKRKAATPTPSITSSSPATSGESQSSADTAQAFFAAARKLPAISYDVQEGTEDSPDEAVTSSPVLSRSASQDLLEMLAKDFGDEMIFDLSCFLDSGGRDRVHSGSGLDGSLCGATTSMPSDESVNDHFGADSQFAVRMRSIEFCPSPSPELDLMECMSEITLTEGIAPPVRSRSVPPLASSPSKVGAEFNGAELRKFHTWGTAPVYISAGAIALVSITMPPVVTACTLLRWTLQGRVWADTSPPDWFLPAAV